MNEEEKIEEQQRRAEERKSREKAERQETIRHIKAQQEERNKKEQERLHELHRKQEQEELERRRKEDKEKEEDEVAGEETFYEKEQRQREEQLWYPLLVLCSFCSPCLLFGDRLLCPSLRMCIVVHWKEKRRLQQGLPVNQSGDDVLKGMDAELHNKVSFSSSTLLFVFCIVSSSSSSFSVLLHSVCGRIDFGVKMKAKWSPESERKACEWVEAVTGDSM